MKKNDSQFDYIKSEINRFKRNDGQTSNNISTDGWGNVLTGLGQRGRDKNNATLFRMCRQYSVGELDEIYRADGMTRRVIDIVPEEMVRQGWEFTNDDENQFLESKLEELNINSIMMDMLRWARLYGGSLGVIGISDGQPLDQPVNYRNIQDVKWVHVFDRYSVSNASGMYDNDMNSPNYGKPIMYLVNDARTGHSFYVHHSRTIRCDWNLLSPRWVGDNNGWGDTLLQTIYEELKNYSGSFANCGTMMHDFINTVLKVPELGQLLASECGSSQVSNRVNIMNLTKSMMNTIIIDSEESYEKLSTNVQGIPEMLDRFMLGLSAVTGIPITLLFGRAPAGLNATGDADIRNFYDMIKQKQEGKLRPMLEKIVGLILRSDNEQFSGIEPEKWKLQFNPLWQNTEEQESVIRRTVAETDAIYIDRGVLDPSEVAVSRFGGSDWSINTEIDLQARDTDFDDEEVERLQREKDLEQEEQGKPESQVSNYNTQS